METVRKSLIFDFTIFCVFGFSACIPKRFSAPPPPPSGAAVRPTAPSNGSPNAPALLDAQVKCTDIGGGDYQYKMTLKWADNSTNENKFVIYTSNSNQFSTPPNKTSFSFEENIPSDTSLNAILVAANEKGESKPVQTSNFTCP